MGIPFSTARIRGAAVAALATGLLAAALPLTSAGAAARTVCTGVAGCRVVAQADVDGDGKVDEVGLKADLRRSDEGKGVVTVRVRTAAGETLSTTNRSVAWFGDDAWHGAARIDGRRGTELVVGQAMGAHSSSFRVITYRDGKLVTLRAPEAPALTGRSDDTATWFTDAAVNFHDGYTRTRSKGVTYVKLTTAERNASGTGHSGWTARYRWLHGGWRLLSVKRAHYATDAAVERAAGWHVEGLPVGA